jgi:hypothetical protein
LVKCYGHVIIAGSIKRVKVNCIFVYIFI